PGGSAIRSAWPAPHPADDRPTDPYGFPPIPGPPPAPPPAMATPATGPARWWAGSNLATASAPGPAPPAPAIAPLLGLAALAAPPAPSPAIPAPHPAEAAALAGAFAVDYLSWDQDDPERRGRVLLDYLPAPGSDPAKLGWSGRGRQRAEIALPGQVRPDGDGRVLVDVRVRVTPYRQVGDHSAEPSAAPEREPDIAGVPAVAPAPTGRGWRSLASYWIRISVPVVSDGGRLVVDAWEESLDDLGIPGSTARSAGGVPTDTARNAGKEPIVTDDPLVEPRSGGTA
ncbi:MAG: hypothetical protein ACRDRH_22635, partial [Pseudonocardia sp.]